MEYIIFSIPVIIVLFVFVYAIKRGLTSVCYTSDITLNRPHTISIVTIPGFFRDKIQLTVDGVIEFMGTAISYPIYPFKTTGLQKLLIDGEEAILRWRWSRVWGDPEYILLEWNGRLIAQVGRKKAIKKLGLSGFEDRLNNKSTNSDSPAT